MLLKEEKFKMVLKHAKEIFVPVPDNNLRKLNFEPVIILNKR